MSIKGPLLTTAVTAPESAMQIPLVIGVTGHRDLRPEDVAVLETRVTGIFRELAAAHAETPFILLCPLAEGADRLVARVALECGVQLIVPLPLPRSEYETDFASDASRHEFARLLGQAQTCIQLPLAEGNTLEKIRHAGEPRSRQYAAVGAFIVQHCQILIALWDGRASDKSGGTAQVVQFRLEGLPAELAPRHNLLNLPELGLLYHVVTPRQGVKSVPAEFNSECAVKRLYCGVHNAGQNQALFDESRLRMKELFHDALRLHSTGAAITAKNATYLLPDDKARGLSLHLKILRQRFAVADMLASYFQKCRHRLLLTLYVSAMAMVSLLEVYVDIQKTDAGKLPWLSAYLLLTLATAGFFVWARAQRYQEKHMDYRALAEGLRVQFFWELANLPDNVADYYLPKHGGELEWIRKSIQNWSIAPPAAGSPIAEPRLDWVQNHWVEDQAVFFEAKSMAKEKMCRRLRWAANLFLGASFAAFCIKWLFHLPHRPGLPLAELADWLVPLAAMFLALYAVLKSFPEKMAYEQETKRYHQMKTVFRLAARKLSDGSPPASAALLRELGHESLVENGDWVLLHRERPLEVHHG